MNQRKPPKELDEFLDEELTIQVSQIITKINHGEPFRVMSPGSVHTMEIRSNRLNVVVDADNIIQSFHYG